jgi:putative ABC transport system permease protein
MPVYLTVKELWRNKSRYFTFSLVIALITILVLFIAGLGEGLATANKEFLEKIDAELLVLQDEVDLSTATSRVAVARLSYLERVPGVEAVGPIGLSNASVVFPLLGDTLDVSLIGVEAGKPGEPEIFEGRRLRTSRGMEVILDEDVARQTGVAVGDTITIKTIQGTEDEYYELEVVGITDGQQYFFLPAIFVPFETWEKVRPQQGSGGERFANIVALQLAEGLDPAAVIPALEAFVDGVEAAEIVTVYEAGPGYAAQQSTVNTQKGFTLLIAILVIGGFFQIQTLQKVPQIGMLKAIGASNRVVAQAAVAQIIFVTGFGVAVGAACTLALSLGFPPSIPIVFTGNAFVAAVISLLAIGPLGGLVAIRAALKVEPLTALGLGG